MRKQVIMGGIVAAVFGALASVSQAQNLVGNPSFEQPPLAANTESGGAGSTWTPYGPVFRQNFTPALAHQGTTYVKVFGNGGMFQDIAVTPGQSFNASAWAQISATDAPTSFMGGQLLVIFRNAANTGDVGTTLASNIVTETSPRDVYQQGLLSGTIPAGAGFVRFQLNQYTGGGGAVFFDDTSFTLGTVVPEPTSLAALGAASTLLVRRRRA